MNLIHNMEIAISSTPTAACWAIKRLAVMMIYVLALNRLLWMLTFHIDLVLIIYKLHITPIRTKCFFAGYVGMSALKCVHFIPQL